MYKIPIVFILYKPCHTFFNRLSYLSELYTLYLYCNCNDSLFYLRNYNHSDNITILGDGKNVGISEACNFICLHLRNKYKYFLLFDQDTVLSKNILLIFDENEFNELSKFSIVQLKSKVNNTFNLKFKNGFTDTNFVINSGSIINIQKALDYNLYNKFFNIDCSDYYYCLKSSIHGLRVGYFNKSYDLDHSSEQPDRKISFLGLQIFIRNYHYKRVYFFNSRIVILLFISLFHFKLYHLQFLLRSFLLYNFKQILARLPLYAS